MTSVNCLAAIVFQSKKRKELVLNRRAWRDLINGASPKPRDIYKKPRDR